MHFFIRTAFMGAIALAAITSIQPSAFAETDLAQVLAAVKSLEGRVAALETQNAKYRGELATARAEARTANERLRAVGATPSRAAGQSPTDSFASLDKAPNWTGPYWGVSAGGAATKSSIFALDRSTIGPPIPGTTTETVTAHGKKSGGFLDAFAGWNAQLSERFVIGAQVEASATALNFGGSGTQLFDGGTASFASPATPHLEAVWMATALARAGVLLDEETLIYGLGGATLARFEYDTSAFGFTTPPGSFWSDGWVAGAGVERKLGSNWSVRAEYRYTQFEERNLNSSFSPATSGAALSQTVSTQRRFDTSMHSGRLGVAYSFPTAR